VRLRKLGGTDAAPVLQSAYDYFDWQDVNGVGRLRYLQTGTPSTPTSLQDFRYYTETDTPKYDAVGNVLRIEDWKAGAPQYQVFTYDNLNRLASAYADGGTYNDGDYASAGSPESYNYDTATGNLTSKAGMSYTYNAQVSGCQGGSRTIPHAVSQAGAVTYTYDCNGNMTVRNYGGGGVYNLSYDAENRMTGLSGATTATFVFDGDGNRVKGTMFGVTIAYIGNYFEWNTDTAGMTKYYYAGSSRVAMRQGAGTGESGLLWLFGDHLGSSHIAANENGSLQSEQLYKSWGEKRYPTGASGLPTTTLG
jgi:hypothetical protein